MKRVLPDTNIYGLLAVDQDIHQLHQHYEEKKLDLRVYGFSVIRRELQKVPKKVVEGINIRASLLRAYSYFVSKEYEIESRFEDIANEYYTAYLSNGGKLSKESIYNDLLIVACASVKDIDIVVSEDNATLASELFTKAYLKVNAKKALRLPEFIRYKAFKKLLLGTGFPNPLINSANKFWVLLGFLYISKGVWFLFHTLLQEKLIYKDFVS